VKQNAETKQKVGVAYLSIKVLASHSNTAVSSTLRHMKLLTATHHVYESRLFIRL